MYYKYVRIITGFLFKSIFVMYKYVRIITGFQFKSIFVIINKYVRIITGFLFKRICVIYIYIYKYVCIVIWFLTAWHSWAQSGAEGPRRWHSTQRRRGDRTGVRGVRQPPRPPLRVVPKRKFFKYYLIT